MEKSFITIKANVDVTVEMSSDIIAAVSRCKDAEPLRMLMHGIGNGVEDAIREAARKNDGKVPDLAEVRKMVQDVKPYDGHCKDHCDCHGIKD